jgi:hypothetical protein
MFVQIIQAGVKDRDGLERQWQKWVSEVMPGAIGFLGSTGGTSDDGELFVTARFEDEEQARRNSERPEQDAWWSETRAFLESEPRFYDTSDVETWLGGGSDDAGFVQVIQGTARDRARLGELMRGDEDLLRTNRPDVIGGLTAWQGDDFTQVVYFTSEAEARAGERKADPSDMAEWQGLVDNVKFIDLRRPFLVSP